MYFETFDGDTVEQSELLTLAEDGVSVYHKGIPFSAQSALDALNDLKDFNFETVPKNSTEDRYLIHEFIHDAGETIAGYAEVGDLYDAKPSAIEVILCKFIYRNYDVDLLDTQRLVFFQSNFPTSANGMLVREFFYANQPTFFSHNSSSIFEALNEEYPPQMVRIVKHACLSAASKYKILDYYRTLEALFLKDILQKINEQYPLDPKKTLENAVDSLKKERDQLISLMSNRQQLDLAKEVNRIIEIKKASGNSYCGKLFEKFSKNKDKPTIEDDAAWRGCWYIYQIRCSIAHAGTDNLVYEYFDDSDDIISDILPIMERILLGCIGVTI